MQTAALTPTFSATLRDLAELAKPRITLMVAITAAGGMRLAPGTVEPWRAAVMLLTTCMVVAGANALNCYLERDSDRLMQRTARRPLPDGRMQPRMALVFGLFLGAVSVPALTLAINPLTGFLGAFALVSYVAIYTPMKQYTPTALLVGAVPGALPPLMGWTAVTNGLEAPGLVLFSILFLWQVPHFIAISIFRQEEYERAGLKVLPSVRGLQASKLQALLWTGVLFITSLLLVPLRVAGLGYAITALVMGALFLGVAFMGLRESAGVKWAKQLFVTSLVYLTVLFTALMLDAA